MNHQTGLILVWVALVPVGWGQTVLDFIFWLPVISPSDQIGAFVLERALGLVAVTAARAMPWVGRSG